MLAEKILESLRSLYKTDKFIGLHEPSFQGNEWTYVKECLDTGWVSSVGKFVDQFEEKLAAYTGAKRAVAVVNGTAALHLALVLAGVDRDDEVLIPTLTFIATANAVKYCGATPHFIDSAYDTMGVDPSSLAAYLETVVEIRGGQSFNRRTGKRFAALVPMHTFGNPVDLDPLAAICDRFHIPLVEDAAESLGSFYKGKHTGNWGRVAALSFNGNKIITTGGGGAVLTNDEELGKKAKHLSTTAKRPHKWEFFHDSVAYNYRLPNLNAAVGCGQLESLPDFLARKQRLAEAYAKTFANIDGVAFFRPPTHSQSNNWLNTLIFSKGREKDRNQLLELSNGSAVMTRPAWNLLHQLPIFADCPRADLTVAEDLAARLITIPSSSHLKIEL